MLIGSRPSMVTKSSQWCWVRVRTFQLALFSFTVSWHMILWRCFKQVKMKELLSGGASKGATAIWGKGLIFSKFVWFLENFVVFHSAANGNLFWQREKDCSLSSEVVYNHWEMSNHTSLSYCWLDRLSHEPFFRMMDLSISLCVSCLSLYLSLFLETNMPVFLLNTANL